MLKYFEDIVTCKRKFIKINDVLYHIKKLIPVVLGGREEVHVLLDDTPVVVSYYTLILREHKQTSRIPFFGKPVKVTVRVITHMCEEQTGKVKHLLRVVDTGTISIETILEDLNTKRTRLSFGIAQLNGKEINPQSQASVKIVTDLIVKGNNRYVYIV